MEFMSEGQSTGETPPSEERYIEVREYLDTWARNNDLKRSITGKQIPEDGLPPIVGRYPYGGLRFSRTLPAEGGGEILELWEAPDGPKPPIKLSYAQIKYNKDGIELSRRRSWYGEKRVERNGVELRQDFDIFEQFDKLKGLIDDLPARTNSGNASIRLVTSEQLPDNVTPIRPSRRK